MTEKMHTKLTKDQIIDLLMLCANLIVLILPLVIGAFYEIDFKWFFTEEYIYSSTINKFSIVLLISDILILIFQCGLSKKDEFGTGTPKRFKKIIIGLLIFIASLVLLFVIIDDLIMMCSSFGGKPPNLNMQFSVAVTVIGFICAIGIGLFCIFKLKIYDLLK